MSKINFPLWHRTGNVAAIAAFLVAIGCSFGFWHWLKALDLPGLTERTYEFFDAPDGISWDRAAIFAVSLVLVSVPRLFCTREQRLKTRVRLRRLIAFFRQLPSTFARFAEENPEVYARDTHRTR